MRRTAQLIILEAAPGMAMWDAAGYSRSKKKKVYPPVVHLLIFLRWDLWDRRWDFCFGIVFV
jgi:hypothetical protein